MVCSSSSTTIDTSYVLQVLSNGDSSKEVVVDHNEGLKPSLEAPVPPYGPDLLKMIQTEEGRAQLNQQQEPLVELLNRKAQKLGLGLKIASKGFAQPSFITKSKTLTTCPATTSTTVEAAAPVDGEVSDDDKDLLDASKIGEANPGNAQFTIISGEGHDMDDEIVASAPPIKKQKTESEELPRGAPREASVALVHKERLISDVRSSQGGSIEGIHQTDIEMSGGRTFPSMIIFCNLDGLFDNVEGSTISLVLEGFEDALTGADEAIVVSAC